MIHLSKITKVYNTGLTEIVALSGVSFDVKRGEFVAIMGPSGSGKSTLMHIIGALDVPTSGKYILDDEDITKLSDDQLAGIRNRKIGFVFQAFNLLPRRSALKNVMLPMIYAELSYEERLQRAEKYLEMVGLGDRLTHTTSQLSGGQMQRVAIARALAMNPAIILADEPTGNLASVQGEEIMQIFKNLNEEGHTIVMITHEPDISWHAKRVITIRDGKVIDDKLNGHKIKNIRRK